MCIQTLLVLLFAFAVFGLTCNGDLFWVIVLTLITGLCGMTFGEYINQIQLYLIYLKKKTILMISFRFCRFVSVRHRKNSDISSHGQFLTNDYVVRNHLADRRHAQIAAIRQLCFASDQVHGESPLHTSEGMGHIRARRVFRFRFDVHMDCYLFNHKHIADQV